MRTYADSDDESTTAGETDTCPASDDEDTPVGEEAGLEYKDHPEHTYDAHVTAKLDLLRADETFNEHHSGSALAAANVQRTISIPVSLSSRAHEDNPHSLNPWVGEAGVQGRQPVAAAPCTGSTSPRSRQPVAAYADCAPDPLLSSPSWQPIAAVDGSRKSNIFSSYPLPVVRNPTRQLWTKINQQPLFPFPAYVATPVNRAEIAKTPLAQAAMQK